MSTNSRERESSECVPSILYGASRMEATRTLRTPALPV